MSSYSREQLETWLKTISIGDTATVLDIGGSQNPVYSRLKSKGGRFTVMDIESPHEVKTAPDIVFDINSSTPPEQLADAYNVVFMLEVSEYLWNPLQAFKNAHFFLRKEGALFASFHTTYPLHKPSGLDYLRYTEFGIKKILTEAGLTVTSIEPRLARNVGVLRAFYDIEGMRPDREYESHDAVGWLVTAIKK